MDTTKKTHLKHTQNTLKLNPSNKGKLEGVSGLFAYELLRSQRARYKAQAQAALKRYNEAGESPFVGVPSVCPVQTKQEAYSDYLRWQGGLEAIEETIKALTDQADLVLKGVMKGE